MAHEEGQGKTPMATGEVGRQSSDGIQEGPRASLWELGRLHRGPEGAF